MQAAVSAEKSTFAQRIQVGKNARSTLKISNCLFFKTKSNLRRHEVIDMLKELKFRFKKLEGVGEMKGQCINIICKTRKDILELNAILI